MSFFKDARFLTSAASAAQFPADSGAEAAFVGRSNAGKSSAINAIVQRQGLARTSKTPGRTQLLNFFEVAPERRIVDLPGYGFADVPAAQRRQWAPMIDALRLRASLCGLVLIVDARRGVSEGDEQLIAWAQPLPVHVLLSKSDKLSRNEGREALSRALARMSASATVQLFSAHTKDGLDAAQRRLQAFFEGKKIPR